MMYNKFLLLIIFEKNNMLSCVRICLQRKQKISCVFGRMHVVSAFQIRNYNNVEEFKSDPILIQ